MRDFRDSSRQTTSPAPPRHTPTPSPIMDSRHSSPTGAGEGVSCTEASGGSLACPALPYTLPPEATAKGTSGTLVASVSGTPETSLASKPESVPQAKCDPSGMFPSGNRNPEKNAQNPADSTSTGEEVSGASRKADPVLVRKPDTATREFAACGSLGPGTPKKEVPGNPGEGLRASSPEGGPTAGCSAKTEPGASSGTPGPGPADAAVPRSSAEPAPAPSGVTESGSLGRGPPEASAKAAPEVLGARDLGQAPREPAGGNARTTLDGRPGMPSAQAAVVLDGAAGAPQPVSPEEEGPGGGKPVSQGDTKASSGRREPVSAGPGGPGGVEAMGASPAGQVAPSSPSPSQSSEKAKAGPDGEGASALPSGEGPPGALGETLVGSSGVPEGGGARAEPSSLAGAQEAAEAKATGTETGTGGSGASQPNSDLERSRGAPPSPGPVGAEPGPGAQGPPPQDAGTQAGAPVWACVSVALSPVAPAEGAGGSAFGFQAPARRDAGLQVSLGAAETRSVATGPMTPQAAAPPAFPEVRVRPGAGPTASATANPEAAEPVRDVSWDEKGMTWEVYGAAMEVEVLGMAIQKHLERQIEEHGRQGGPAPAPPQPAPAARDPGPAKRPPGLFRALLQSVRRPRCCSRAGPTAE